MSRSRIPDEELIVIVQEIAKKLGRTPKSREVPKYQTMLDRWGSWEEILELAGMTPLVRTPKFSNDELRNIVIQTKTILHRQGKVFSRNNYDELWKSSRCLPSSSTIVQRLGGWKNAKKIWQ